MRLEGVRATTLVALTAGGAAGAVAVLHHLGRHPRLTIAWGDLGGWLATSPAADVVLTAAWLVALACAWWLLVSTVLAVVVRLVRLPRAVKAVDWLALPAVRAAANRLVAATLLGSTVAGAVPAVAAPSPPAPVTAAEQPTDPPDELRELVPPVVPQLKAGPASPEPKPSSPARQGPPEQSEPLAAGRRGAVHLVVAGEHLWQIAHDRLVAAGRPHGRGQVAGYWQQVVATNRDRLASGDPDLIYPGEEVVLPALPEQEEK